MSAKKRRGVRGEDSFNKEHLIVGAVLIFIFLVALSFVDVSKPPVERVPSLISGYVPIGSGSGDFFKQWREGDLDAAVAKYFFFFILVLLVFSSLSFAGFPDSKFLQFLMAVLVSFLATAYIAPSEVYAILTSYTALGLTLSVVVPFAAMIFTSAAILGTGKISIGKIVLEVLLWFFFSGFLLYKIVGGFFGGGTSKGVLVVMLAVFVFSVFILVFNKYFRKWIRTLGIEIVRTKGEIQRSQLQEGAKYIRAASPGED